MSSDPLAFQPRFPWVDDERDTTTYIKYDLPNRDDDYIPTYVIMKQLYDEEKERIYGKDWNKPCIWDYIQDSDDEYDYDVEYGSPLSKYSDRESDYDYDYNSDASDNESEEVAISQPPSVSNKFWYS